MCCHRTRKQTGVLSFTCLQKNRDLSARCSAASQQCEAAGPRRFQAWNLTHPSRKALIHITRPIGILWGDTANSCVSNDILPLLYRNAVHFKAVHLLCVISALVMLTQIAHCFYALTASGKVVFFLLNSLLFFYYHLFKVNRPLRQHFITQAKTSVEDVSSLVDTNIR